MKMVELSLRFLCPPVLALSLAACGNTTEDPSNHSPSISGVPVTLITIGENYSFTPVATDDDGDTLTFSIANKPIWATFDTDNGQLSGIPGETHAGVTTDIVISVSDGQETVSLSAFTLNVEANNHPPTISGTPGTSVTIAGNYLFAPVATDDDDDTLTFTIINKPTWATFDTNNGQLSGAPGETHVGTTSNVTISVSDGSETVALPSFNLSVAYGSATLSWVAPVVRADNTPLAMNEIGGYRIYHGSDPEQLELLDVINGVTTTEYIADSLTAGAHYFGVTSFDTHGTESSMSNISLKTLN